MAKKYHEWNLWKYHFNFPYKLLEYKYSRKPSRIQIPNIMDFLCIFLKWSCDRRYIVFFHCRYEKEYRNEAIDLSVRKFIFNVKIFQFFFTSCFEFCQCYVDHSHVIPLQLITRLILCFECGPYGNLWYSKLWILSGKSRGVNLVET